MKNRLVALVAVLVAAVVLTIGASASTTGWSVGTSDANVTNPAGTSDLDLNSNADTNITAGHIRMVSNNSTFEFENRVGYSRLLAYIAGTPTRTTLIAGDAADGANIVPLKLDVPATQTNDLFQMRKNSAVVTAFDATGRLRMNGITVELQVLNGTLALVATMPDGSKRYSVFGTTPP